MLAKRYAAVMPVTDRNPVRNPAQLYPVSSSSDSESDLDSSERESESANDSDAGSSASAASSASDSADAQLEGDKESEGSADESDDDLARPLRRAYSSSSSVSSVSSDSDALDGGADFFLEKTSRRRGYPSIDLQSEPSMFPAAMRSDNLGVVAWLIPAIGVATMFGTDTLACIYHFECPDKFPTLSYAATFKPEGYVFTVGMCITSIFIAATIALFYWFLKLRWHTSNSVVSTQQRFAGLVVLVCGEMCAVALFGLAVFDMRNHHDIHIISTIVFFATSWAMMVAVHQSRRLILQSNNSSKGDDVVSSCTSIGDGPVSLLSSLRRWKRLKIAAAHRLGKLMLLMGLASTALFALLFVCVNGVWPNPVGFTAAQEAFFEAFAIVCQLFFMGTASCELSMLTHLVEHQDYTQLERAE